MVEGKYSKAERMFLEGALPSGCSLDFDYDTQEYDIWYKKPGTTTGKLIAKVSRSTVLNYIRPKPTLNYVARRAMLANNIPVKMITNTGRDGS